MENKLNSFRSYYDLISNGVSFDCSFPSRTRYLSFRSSDLVDNSGCVSRVSLARSVSPLESFSHFNFNDFSIMSIAKAGGLDKLEFTMLSNSSLSEPSIDSFLDTIDKVSSDVKS